MWREFSDVNEASDQWDLSLSEGILFWVVLAQSGMPIKRRAGALPEVRGSKWQASLDVHEEWSLHELFNCKETNSVTHLRKSRHLSHPSQASDENTVQLTAWLNSGGTVSKGRS